MESRLNIILVLVIRERGTWNCRNCDREHSKITRNFVTIFQSTVEEKYSCI